MWVSRLPGQMPSSSPIRFRRASPSTVGRLPIGRACDPISGPATLTCTYTGRGRRHRQALDRLSSPARRAGRARSPIAHGGLTAASGCKIRQGDNNASCVTVSVPPPPPPLKCDPKRPSRATTAAFASTSRCQRILNLVLLRYWNDAQGRHGCVRAVLQEPLIPNAKDTACVCPGTGCLQWGQLRCAETAVPGTRGSHKNGTACICPDNTKPDGQGMRGAHSNNPGINLPKIPAAEFHMGTPMSRRKRHALERD